MTSKFKKSFPLVCRACPDESIDIIRYSFEYFSAFGQYFENEFEIWKKLSISL